MVNHPEEDSIQIHPPNPQDVHIYCGPVNFPWSCGGPLECWFFEDLLRFVCIVEHGEETEVITLFEVVAVWEELDFFVYGVIIFSFGLTVSRVGFSVSSIQVNIFQVSTVLKTRLATLAYDFCAGESFAAETNLRASGYEMVFFWFDLLDFFFFEKILTIFRWRHVRLTTIGALRIVITIETLVVFLCTLKTSKFPFTMSEFLTLKASYWTRDIWTDFHIVKAHANRW